MVKSITAIYPGSFDPLTNGHLDIIERTSNLFTNVIVAVANNVNKKHLFTIDERIGLLSQSIEKLGNVKVHSFEGLLADYIRSINSFVLIRGLRVLSDFEYEFQIALMNRKLDKNIETVFLMTSQSYVFLSSSVIKEIALLNGNIKDFVPKHVAKALKRKRLDHLASM
ncbi:MAG: pantetheine-phosphate adenylyltransferase [Elusimicrobiota bacterium]|jgi:pantetheine-phosphate adenylyltransferase|nr:pantetheine-phosphate adenylyltransferase [Elusimicrobiota bacterium]